MPWEYPPHRRCHVHGREDPTSRPRARARAPREAPRPAAPRQLTESRETERPWCWPPCSSTIPTAKPEAGEEAAKPDPLPPAPPAFSSYRRSRCHRGACRRWKPRDAGHRASRFSKKPTADGLRITTDLGERETTIQISIQLRCNVEKRFCLIENSPGEAN